MTMPRPIGPDAPDPVATNRDHRSTFTDFTEAAYAALLPLAAKTYAFARFNEPLSAPHVLWRHDIDASLPRAVRLAEIEHAAGVIATYFVYLRGLFYNPLSSPAVERIRRLVALGHDIGLHFDPTAYGPPLDDAGWRSQLRIERDLLTAIAGVAPVAVSFHLFGVLDPPPPDDDTLLGMVNAYGATLRRDYGYVSDSNGIWRFRRLADVLSAAIEPRLQVLTHPEWWAERPMPPRQRLQRCIEEAAAEMGDTYDRIVDAAGRPNIR